MNELELYRLMARARAFEVVLADLWERGLISGEMHLGTGEEAVVAGVVSQLGPHDAVALDHRPTPVLTSLGVSLEAMLAEMLGRTEGLCGGAGGHMHLFSKERLACSSGIVGSAAPAAVGLALAARRLRPQSVAVGFFGDGAFNQGMVMESLNLAAAWNVPALFVCKDNGWAITARKSETTPGNLLERARSFALAVEEVDGTDPAAVHESFRRLLEPARKKGRPGFLLATCPRLDGHFLGDPMVRLAKRPVAEGGELLSKVLSAATQKGGGLGGRAAALTHMMGALLTARSAGRDASDDPLPRARERLRKQAAEVERVDADVAQEMARVVEAVVGKEAPR